MAKVVRAVVRSDAAPAPVGPYNQAILLGKTLYISGNLGLDKSTGKLVPGGVECETRQALDNLGCILKKGGSSYEKVVKTTVLLADIKDFPVINEIYEEYFGENPPARSTFQVGKLPLDARIEIEAIAASGDVEFCGDA